MDIKDMYGQAKFDTRTVRAGAVEYVTCPTCGAHPKSPCQFRPGATIENFAHIGRRFEYVEGLDIFFGAPTVIPPEVWLRCAQGRHAECIRHPTSCKCDPPDPCECSCHAACPSCKAQYGHSPSCLYDLLG